MGQVKQVCSENEYLLDMSVNALLGAEKEAAEVIPLFYESGIVFVGHFVGLSAQSATAIAARRIKNKSEMAGWLESVDKVLEEVGLSLGMNVNGTKFSQKYGARPRTYPVLHT